VLSSVKTTPLISISRDLAREVTRLRFVAPVSHVYLPLDYAAAPHEAYLRRYGQPPRRVVLLGMNPGPFGMAQTGVPFGDVNMVRDWLGLEGPVGQPARVHPKRPVAGFGCQRSEVSGTRLWGWARDRFGTPASFFATFFVANYCPLAFFEASGRNRTPDKLPAGEQAPLFAACDRALRRLVEAMQPTHVVGVGSFACKRARTALHGFDVAVATILHPSPASPLANRGWAAAASRQLDALGIGLTAPGDRETLD
jgi:single-strand selective monofunctional uracil DNA glycosylase